MAALPVAEAALARRAVRTAPAPTVDHRPIATAVRALSAERHGIVCEGAVRTPVSRVARTLVEQAQASEALLVLIARTSAELVRAEIVFVESWVLGPLLHFQCGLRQHAVVACVLRSALSHALTLGIDTPPPIRDNIPRVNSHL